MAKAKAVEGASEARQPQESSVANVSTEALVEAFGKMLEKFAVPQQSPEALAEALAAAIETSRGVRQIKIGEWKPGGPFNPKRKKRTLKGEFWVNGLPLRERVLHDEEIALLHEITPGLYVNKRITVSRTTTPDNQITQISFPEKAPADRLENAKLFPTFAVMLRKIVEEGKERDALLGDEKVVKAVNIMLEQRKFAK